MAEFAEKSLMYGLKFGFNFLNSEQQEIVGAVLRIAKSLSDEKILELGSKGGDKK